MDCEQARQLVVDSMYDELPPESVPELQEHLAGCEACSIYKEGVQQALECLNQAEELRAPVDLAALHDAIAGKRHPIGQFLRQRWPMWAAIVGLCGIMLSIFALLASEIRYQDKVLTIRFNGQEADTLAERTELVLAGYRQDQLRFQTLMYNELKTAMTELSQMVDEHESQRDERIARAFQEMQVQRYQTLVAIQGELETLASRTEDEFRRSYLTIAELVNLQ